MKDDKNQKNQDQNQNQEETSSESVQTVDVVTPDQTKTEVNEQPTEKIEQAEQAEPEVSSQQPAAESEDVEETEVAPKPASKKQKKDQKEEVSVEEPTEEELEKAKKVISEDKPADPSKWYIVHTYSGHENKVAKSIKQRVQSLGFENRIFDIIVPTRNTIKVSQGKKETVKEKIFPGYVLVKMILDDESWLLVRTTQGVTAFIGAGNKPTPISDKEVEAIQKFMDAEEPLYKTAFTIGEAVKIVDGPFSDFLGTIDNIDEAKGKLKVLVSIFGRETPVELDFLQVNKL